MPPKCTSIPNYPNNVISHSPELPASHPLCPVMNQAEPQSFNMEEALKGLATIGGGWTASFGAEVGVRAAAYKISGTALRGAVAFGMREAVLNPRNLMLVGEVLGPSVAGIALGYGVVKSGIGETIGLKALGEYLADKVGPGDTQSASFQYLDSLFRYFGLL